MPPKPYNLVLEFSRARNADQPHAFRFAPQTYHLRGPGGAYESSKFGWSDPLLHALEALRAPERPPELVHKIGAKLRDFLAPAGWAQHEEAIVKAARDGAPIFLTIRSAAAELYVLPWELVALKATGQLLGGIPGLLIRYEWPGTTTCPARAQPARRGRVLFAWSGAVPAAAHQAALSANCSGFDPTRDVLAGATLAAIERALADAAKTGPPIDALHLLCHGAALDQSFGLELRDEKDRPVVVDAGRMQQLLAPHAGMVRVVVLAACDSGNSGRLGNHLGSVAQMLHRVGIQTTIASRYPLSARGSVSFTEAFYAALRGGATLAAAFVRAREELALNPRELDWASIQLYSHEADGEATYPLALVVPPPSRLTTAATDRTTGPGVAAPPAAILSGAAREALWRLITRFFSTEEFRRFVAFFPTSRGDSDLTTAIPEKGSMEDLAHEFVTKAERAGILAETFQELRRSRPKRLAEIDDVARLFPPALTTAAGAEETTATAGDIREAKQEVPARPDADKAPLDAPEYWSDSQVEARLAAILSGATALAESLDSRLEKHSSKNHNPLPQPERAARRIMGLGKGLKAAHTLTEACYDATLAKDADAAGDRPAARNLLSEWFPYGYRDAARVVVLRLTDGTADPRNLRASSHREHFVEIYMASDDGRACNFTSTQIDGLGRSVAESMFPAPPGSSQRMSGDAIAQKLVDALSSRFEVRSVGDLKAEFKDQATKHKMTPYLLVRVPIGQNGLSDATLRRLHELLPSLRVVALPDASASHELEDELWRWMIKLFAN